MAAQIVSMLRQTCPSRTLLFIVLAAVAVGCSGTSHKQSAKPASRVSIRFLGYYRTNEQWDSEYVAQFSIANRNNKPVSLYFAVETNLGSNAEKFFDEGGKCFAFTNLNANSMSYFAFFSREGYSGLTNAWRFPVVVIHNRTWIEGRFAHDGVEILQSGD